MLLDGGEVFQTEQRGKVLKQIITALASSKRETDVIGWYKDNCVMGLIFTEVGARETNSILSAMLAKVSTALRNNLDLKLLNEIHVSFHLFPEEWDQQNGANQANSKLYPDLANRCDLNKFARLVKRSMDVVGSVLALIALSPLFVVISLLIKLTSRGPALFRQARVGQYGRIFTFLKFRSMHFINDPNIHKEYYNRFIGGEAASESGVYKITEDPRVTGIGKLLRRTSLDELPQFWNVLKGEMSLVGPRPPIPYELESYDVWHRRRVLEAKPGITGLWQVNGRSKTGFDDMVRLDLRYARAWSLWLDLKILLQTPRAVLSVDGAY